ncbi:hypothetical protein, partial [Bacteriovorax sp. DB6_IX]|uniref:hypothetical protein n=1 Tax=Bacteriovorax sp. DB6_IX TaxID=1353530 RepID=UPI0005526DC3
LDTYLQGALSGYDTKLSKVVTSEEMRPKCWFNNEKTTYDAGQIDDKVKSSIYDGISRDSSCQK